MVLAAPTAPEGDGFYPYTVKEGSKDVTHYYVTHYEVGEKAEELTVMATGKQLTYQWYYRLSEDETEAGTAIEDATEATYTPDTSAETGMRFYYCVVTNPAGSAKTGGQPVIVCKNPTATIYFSLTDDDKYVAAESSGNIMAYQKVTVPYFDLKAYHLEGNYFKSETYGPADADDPMGGSQLVAGSSAAAYGKITALHLLIWMTEREYLGVSADKAGQGYLYDENLMDSDIFGIAASSTVGSVLIQNFWTHDMNFNYYMNYVYPLAAEGWGATADQILMRDGDIFSMMMYSDWSFYNDEWAGYHHLGNELNKTMVETQLKADASIALPLYRSYGHDSSSYATDHVVVGSLDVYYIETSKLTSGDVTDWTKAGTVDENGKFTLDAKALKLEAGKQYLFSVAGQKGKDVDAFVSCPGGVLVNVLDADAALTWNVRFKNGKEDYAAKQVENGKLVTVENPTREGYTFTGWSPEVGVAEEDVTYTAQYEPIARVFYTITFNANGGVGSMEPQRFEVGVDTALNANAFTSEGDKYKFIGWNTAADGSGATYADEGAILELTGDMTLYAQWQFWNGWLTDVNGKQYYQDGELLKTGWTVIDGNTYYLDTETGFARRGISELVPKGAEKTARCVFDADGVFQSDVTGVYSVGDDTYWLNSGIIEEEAGLKRVVKENGEVNYYYFAVQKNLEEREGLTLSAAVKSTVLNGKDCWLHKTNGLALPEWGYYFDENGVILHDEDTGKNGILKAGEDLFYYVDGIKAPAGMIKIGDDYYYANSKGQLIVNQTYYCSRMNGLMEEGTYAFDAEGKLIPGATDKNGIVKDDDGVLRYYVNGKVTYVGLIEINGDFYYVRSSGEVVTNCVYWITWTHGL